MRMDMVALLEKVISAPNTGGLGGYPGLFGECALPYADANGKHDLANFKFSFQTFDVSEQLEDIIVPLLWGKRGFLFYFIFSFFLFKQAGCTRRNLVFCRCKWSTRL